MEASPSRRRALDAASNGPSSSIVEGKVIEELVIDKPILTIKNKGVAKSKIDAKKGKSAKTTLFPMLVEGNKSKIKLVSKKSASRKTIDDLIFAYNEKS